jgi:hypothetical protein
LEKSKTSLQVEEASRIEGLKQKGPSTIEVSCSKRIKPRALVFKAHDGDLHRIRELIEAQFPDVEILYVTTGPAKSFLHVTKSMPFELQNSSENPFYSVEGL